MSTATRTSRPDAPTIGELSEMLRNLRRETFNGQASASHRADLVARQVRILRKMATVCEAVRRVVVRDLALEVSDEASVSLCGLAALWVAEEYGTR
ncbi:hypothetical protein [Saccharothrix hoggarensis]|uniref:Uncharacterized protein n=1 Tax=Saccharothrix hoggarensis TaxID=913853 RepID=A0ABW3QGE6_9PSEU